MGYKRSWWMEERVLSLAWLVLFLPALACYTYFLSMHLNQYPEVEGSLVERLNPSLGQIIPVGAKVYDQYGLKPNKTMEVPREMSSQGSHSNPQAARG